MQVSDAEALEKAIADLLADENRRAELGRNALKVVAENLGAVDRTVEMILEQLKTRGSLYRARKIILDVSPLDETETAYHIRVRFRFCESEV